MKTLLQTIALLIIGILIGMFIEVDALAQNTLHVWSFTANRQLPVHQSRSLNSPLIYNMQAGDTQQLYGAYVQAEDLIWGELLTGGYVTVARYGTCEIASFGTYNPPEYQPINSVDTRRKPATFNQQGQ